MPADDLNKPLGLAPRKPTRARSTPLPRPPLAVAGIAVAIVAAITASAWLLLPFGRGPTATAVIDGSADLAAIGADRTGTILAAPPLSEVQASGELSELNQVVIHGLPDAPLQLAAIPDDSLIEDSPDGPLPRIAPDGTRPLDAYARPSRSESRATKIAIVIGGIGIDPAGTQNAIASLPGEVTLAFAPYGDDLEAAVAAARNRGHEILLQVPLEPFNYPRTDPGPNTLTANASVEENISRLHWFLSRITNYVGVVNYMGARFTHEQDAIAPVIAEIGQRGLLYLDDGSSARSTAEVAAAGIAPFIRADLVLDAELSTAAIDQKLRQLQAIATERGYAIATGTAFPMTVDRVAAFVKAATDRGIAIVPVSALVAGRT